MDIFNDFSMAVGCEYISDLRYLPFSPSLLKKISDFSETQYSMKEYNELASYFLNTPTGFQTVREAKQAILTYFKQKNSK